MGITSLGNSRSATTMVPKNFFLLFPLFFGEMRVDNKRIQTLVKFDNLFRCCGSNTDRRHLWMNISVNHCLKLFIYNVWIFECRVLMRWWFCFNVTWCHNQYYYLCLNLDSFSNHGYITVVISLWFFFLKMVHKNVYLLLSHQ